MVRKNGSFVLSIYYASEVNLFTLFLIELRYRNDIFFTMNFEYWRLECC